MPKQVYGSIFIFWGEYSGDIQLTTMDNQQIFRKYFRQPMLNSGAVNLYRNRFSFGSCPPGYQTASGVEFLAKQKPLHLRGGQKNRKDSMLFSMLLMIAQLEGPTPN